MSEAMRALKTFSMTSQLIEHELDEIEKEYSMNRPGNPGGYLV
jgi:hypothetical protein